MLGLNTYFVIVKRCEVILKNLEPPRRWMTAGNLAKRIGLAHGEETVRAALMQHSQLSDRCIRYCMYPSRRTLDVLWGHVAVVKERDLDPLTREQMDDDLETDTVTFAGENRQNSFFLSHNHRDATKVIELRSALHDLGYFAWIFEDGISNGAIINDEVQNALRNQSSFMAFLSKNYFSSVWVDKELDRVPNVKQVAYVMDADEEDLVCLFRKLSFSDLRRDECLISEYLSNSNASNCKFELLMQVRNRIAGSSAQIYVYPWPSQEVPRSSSRFQPIERLPESFAETDT
jgi:hypothetical protein